MGILASPVPCFPDSSQLLVQSSLRIHSPSLPLFGSAILAIWTVVTAIEKSTQLQNCWHANIPSSQVREAFNSNGNWWVRNWWGHHQCNLLYNPLILVYIPNTTTYPILVQATRQMYIQAIYCKALTIYFISFSWRMGIRGFLLLATGKSSGKRVGKWFDNVLCTHIVVW